MDIVYLRNEPLYVTVSGLSLWSPIFGTKYESEAAFFSHLSITSLLLYIHVYPNTRITHFSSRNEQRLGTIKVSEIFFGQLGHWSEKCSTFTLLFMYEVCVKINLNS
jgi:hypothetical protein